MYKNATTGHTGVDTSSYSAGLLALQLRSEHGYERLASLRSRNVNAIVNGILYNGR